MTEVSLQNSAVLNSLASDFKPGIPSHSEGRQPQLLPCFRELSQALQSNFVLVRYQDYKVHCNS